MKWREEYSVYPLFNPMSVIAEGTAVFAAELLMPFKERVTFEQKVLFLLAGLDSDKVEEYFRIVEVTKALDYVYIEAAIKYLDGNFTEEETVNWLIKYKLDSKEKARRRLKFIQQYRSYVINLYVGYNIVKNYIESTGGTPDNNE